MKVVKDISHPILHPVKQFYARLNSIHSVFFCSSRKVEPIACKSSMHLAIGQNNGGGREIDFSLAIGNKG
jgi:hypothetical protein